MQSAPHPVFRSVPESATAKIGPGIVRLTYGSKIARCEARRAISSALFCDGSFRKLDGSTGLLDLFDSCLGGACRFDGDLCLQLAIRKDAHAVLDATDNAGGLESSSIDGRLGVELLGIDRSLDTAVRNGDVFRCKDVVEAALRQATIDRHLAALEAVDGNAGARLLALDAATTGLALAGTDTATDADTVLGGTVVIFDFVQFHDDFLRLTS